MNNQKIGYLLAFSAPFLYSVFNACFKIMSAELNALSFLLVRGLTGMALVGLVALATGSRPERRHWTVLILAGLASAMSTACITTAITIIPLYQAIVILYLYPAMSVILSWLINREKIGLLEIIGLAVAFAGCVLLVWPDESAGLELKAAHFIAVLGSVFFALCCVLIRRLGSDNNGLWPFFSFSLFCALSAFPLAWTFGVQIAYDRPKLLALGASMAVIASLAQVITYAALKYLPAFKVGIIGSLEVLGGALASVIIFHEPLPIKAVIGGGLILYAAFGFKRKVTVQDDERDYV
ncbi:MAG: DMT family transporter [Deltaproteobacteria bacterium]|jgi:drug/metabolite transporter (DMT)-like permease|nr:DMT family transporter [Deltaproteobacteria bacterium]